MFVLGSTFMTQLGITTAASQTTSLELVISASSVVPSKLSEGHFHLQKTRAVENGILEQPWITAWTSKAAPTSRVGLLRGDSVARMASKMTNWNS